MPRCATPNHRSFASLNMLLRQCKLTIAKLQQENEFLSKNQCKHQCNNNVSAQQSDNTSIESLSTSFASVEVHQPEILPENLWVDNFHDYYANLIKNYPFMTVMMRMLINKHQERKLRSSSTNLNWCSWFFVYQSFLADMLIRAKQGKIIMRTTILISLILLYTKASKPVWDMLRKIRVVCLQQKLTRWIQEQPPKVVNKKNIKLFSFDNCDFFRHVTNVRSTNKSVMINTCTQIIADLQEKHHIEIADLWQPVHRQEFVDMLCGDFDTANKTANEAFLSVSEVVATNWLKFAQVEGLESDLTADITILEPLIPCNTSTYADVKTVLEKFCVNHMHLGSTSYAFVSVDQSCHSLVWNLKKKYPQQFSLFLENGTGHGTF